jgi:hypothetical protein
MQRKTSRQSKIPQVLGLAGGLAAVEIAARLNVRCEQARRRDLDGRLFRRVLGEDSLANRYRLIFVDALGFGRSLWPDELAGARGPGGMLGL